MLVRARLAIAGQSANAVHQSQVAQRLRHVADQPFGPSVILFAEQPDVVAELVAHPDEPSRKELSGVSSAQWKWRLLELFADDIDLIGEIIESTRGEIGAYPIHDIPTAPTWHKGPAVLIGDAMHATSPSSGQGASMAIEDALVLAKCLRDIPNAETAFTAYERLRRERVEKVVAYSRRIGQSKAISNPVARWLRDQIMPYALKHFANSDSHAWLYSYHIDWNEKVAAGESLQEQAGARNKGSVEV